MERSVLVIGLSYGGQACATAFADSGKDVICVDKRDYFYDVIRSCIILGWDDPLNPPPRIAYPFHSFLKGKPVTVIQAEAQEYQQDEGVKLLYNGKELKLRVNHAGSYDGTIEELPEKVQRAVNEGVEQIVFGTGSSTPLPLCPANHLNSYRDFQPAWDQFCEKISKAKTFVCVGGGLTGTELAGYLSDVKPEGVYLCSRGPVLSAYTPSFEKTATNEMRRMLGERLKIGAIPKESYAHDTDFESFVFFESPTDVSLTNGDIILGVNAMFYGYSSSDFLTTKSTLNKQATIVDRDMKSIENPEISVIGDLKAFSDENLNDCRMGYHALLQGKAVGNGKSTQPPKSRAVISPFGKSHGASLLPIPILGESAVGPAMTAKLTSFKHYMGYKGLQNAFGVDTHPLEPEKKDET